MATLTRTRFLRHAATHAASDGGGGVSIAAGAFHISDSLFDTNSADPEQNGGGLLVTGATGSIESTTFRGNIVSESGSGGGGLSINGGAEVDIQNCTFVSNTAVRDGSAVFIDGGSSVTIQDSLMESNTILTSAGTIYASGESTVAINNTVIRNNKLTGQFACGFYFAGSDVTFEDVIIEANTIESAGANYAAAGFITEAAQLTFNRVDFIGNVGQADTVTVTSGANLACTDCRFLENQVETTGSALMLTGGSAATFVSSTFVGNSGETSFSLSDEDSALKIQASVIANTSNSVALIHDVTGNDFAVALETVTFGSNAGGPALASAGLVLVQNCDGLTAEDVTNVSLGTCGNTLDYCFAAACTDASIGTDCICLINGVEQLMPTGCMESAQVVMAAPSSRDLRLLAPKPDNLTHEMVLSNPGDESLEWELLVAGIPGLSVSFTSGVLAGNALVVLPVHYASAATQARSEPYLGHITIRAVSGVCECREQELTIDVRITVSAGASAIEVVLLNAATVTASGTLNFQVYPVDSTGMAILNTGDIAYAATIQQPDGTGQTDCPVTYYATTDQHRGECKLPPLVTGSFQLSVTDIITGLSVGFLPVTVTRCPVGHWRPSVRSKTVYPCPVSTACAGGNGTGDELCAPGYKGALCGACASDYYPALNGKCRSCAHWTRGKIKTIAIAIAVLVAFAILVVLAATTHVRDGARSGIADDDAAIAADDTHDANSFGSVELATRGSAENFAKSASRTYESPAPEPATTSTMYRIKMWHATTSLPVNLYQLKILWATFQIISTVEESLDISLPEPFSTFMGWLSFIFTLEVDSLIPIACIETKWSFYQKLMLWTLVPCAIVMLIALMMVMRLRFAERSANVRTSIFASHIRMMMLVAFVAYPTSSLKIFEMLKQCNGFRVDEERDVYYMKADAKLSCTRPTYDAHYVFAIFALVLLTCGVPIMYAVILFNRRRRINPAAKDDPTKLRLRAADPALLPMTFLFNGYRPACWFWEPFSMIHRMIMIGAVSGMGEGALRAGAATLLALVFFFVYREASPYTDYLTNILAHICQLLVFVVFLASFMVQAEPFPFSPFALGVVLVVMVVLVLITFVAFGMQKKAQLTEQMLRLREMEFRDWEADMDILELRADVQSLRMRYEKAKLAAEAEQRRNITHTSGTPVLQRTNTRLRLMLQDATERSRTPTLPCCTTICAPRGDSNISFLRARYPCFVVAVNSLQRYERLPVHEDAAAANELELLSPTTMAPSSAFTYFISQNWETYGDSPHPDNKRNTKLRWLQNIKKHVKVPSTVTDLWIWWDLISVPQRNHAEQVAAVSSLCYYAQLVSRFIPLVRSEREWLALYPEDISDPKPSLKCGTISTYASRGWCRLEMAAGLAPKRFPSGAWRPGPRNVRFRFHADPDDAGIGPLLTSDMLNDPLQGQFTVDHDREVIYPVVVAIADRFAEYVASGSDVWDATIDARTRPAWLKELSLPDDEAGLASDHRKTCIAPCPSIDSSPTALASHSVAATGDASSPGSGASPEAATVADEHEGYLPAFLCLRDTTSDGGAGGALAEEKRECPQQDRDGVALTTTSIRN